MQKFWVQKDKKTGRFGVWTESAGGFETRVSDWYKTREAAQAWADEQADKANSAEVEAV